MYVLAPHNGLWDMVNIVIMFPCSDPELALAPKLLWDYANGYIALYVCATVQRYLTVVGILIGGDIVNVSTLKSINGSPTR